ncbi:MAG: UDP-N-acetylmuramoyl-L-alanyl-D-glutamate--2,6-diaminopimelate ligase [Candidatus Raymondbacteria bacterium RifOxyA12_full_50_37]|uniref:UDP-N-acetylmuramoyl-L-alanyl-D-glutamate--2,6-diaminopimelate ligase n=1 Tax=Candidatus Raymondbacteria bacterium RIFOXYD12_FULL_49_13 TaxID=1817890 RepID=A0A1F7FCK6_UNCRA|nr:MAG: UDP-N-acetylmuramoyl-L-alanyl-D-glutamate--2,6-diaminopimelate ligase [Candidatus Raymondbacteria bacterium RifOxyA12_full_50_37]OGJ86316.1 MAG: UDP-N-acetylmuramoyl-L-alanyl-D-glutamate--2,6-diaminopimelate ligase [Candidatus Raymondbacteria bacterium RIFOXYA2_FULL_49_16]OGJ95854.1 MAG: UDP-N-acetylmuramoyl-L-alanyl-D-glutamate--2,6-diaminopimelate ligase [Candidatus Raymondbacteria bacterium RIFOXYC2_FULL_50_21]OGK04420.1 MAG: UDP-N-acetylmuramoyl-L-alanyl-D-glutamate--2,6-diaminopimel
MKLAAVFKGIAVDGFGTTAADISAVTCSSLAAGPGTVFFALRGEVRDGNSFVADACARGCKVVVSETRHEIPGVISLVVPDAREAMASAAHNLYGHPAQSLRIAGITGTNGKTTTSYLLDSILRGTSGQSNIIGTIRHLVHGRSVESRNTTPEAYDVCAFIREAVDKGSRHMVMEVSSHALKMKRVHGISFMAAVFTNLTRDHMDFHRDEDDYLQAKLSLFNMYLNEKGTGIINADDPHAQDFVNACKAQTLLYGIGNNRADIFPRSVAHTPQGTTLDLQTPSGLFSLASPLKGPFNVYNIMAAAAAGFALGIPIPQIQAGIARIDRVDGRFESVDCGQDFNVIVDYAHTPDALENILRAARAITTGSMILVFGCGGNRDPGKRPLMGAIAEAMADYTFVTSDNPRKEPPDEIIRQIETGMKNRDAYTVIEDRAQAIAAAIARASSHDTVVIAGKGHEDYQILGETKIHFDDREAAREVLRKVNHGAAVC